jgi:hypothetical protein
MSATVVIRSIAPGTFNTTIGQTSKVGHAWIEIRHPDGTMESGGYYPITQSATADGVVRSFDGPGYIGQGFTSNAVQITDEQIGMLRLWMASTDAYGNWTIPGSSSDGPAWNCGSWAAQAIRFARIDLNVGPDWLNWMPWFVPGFDPYETELNITNWEAEGWLIDSTISSATSTFFSSAQSWRAPRDPLVLDLDGDGIETVGINASAPILFDHNADGIRAGTGWIKADDALLVRDINGNGLIDSGRELFGDNTLVTDQYGVTTTASNGFTALAPLDTNNDKQINSLDAVFSQLKIWRDLNQDGTSQAGELQTLSQAGITSISVQGTTTNVNLGNGNTQIAEGSFVRSNGSVGKSGVAELSGSLLLASNGFYRAFTDDPTLTSAAKTPPQMQGSGWARDLREAMSQTGDLSDEALALEQKVAAFAGAGERRCAQRLRAHTRTRRIHARASAQNTQSTVL